MGIFFLILRVPPYYPVRFRRDNDLAREGVSQGSGLAGYIGEIIYGLPRPDKEAMKKKI